MQRSKVLGAALGVILGGMAQSATAQSEIKIGEINSYSLLPAFTEPYRKGSRQLAVEEVNAGGGAQRQEAGRRLQGRWRQARRRADRRQ